MHLLQVLCFVCNFNFCSPFRSLKMQFQDCSDPKTMSKVTTSNVARFISCSLAFSVPMIVAEKSANGDASLQSSYSAANNFASFLSRRVASLDMDSYRPGIQDSDVNYPNWYCILLIVFIDRLNFAIMLRMKGEWIVDSAFASFFPPLGVEVIGGKSIADAAEKELGSILEYKSNFIQVNGVSVLISV